MALDCSRSISWRSLVTGKSNEPEVVDKEVREGEIKGRRMEGRMEIKGGKGSRANESGLVANQSSN